MVKILTLFHIAGRALHAQRAQPALRIDARNLSPWRLYHGLAWLLSTLVLTLPPAQAATPATVRVFAAASLTDVLQHIGAAFQRSHPGDRIEFSFAGSQVLRTQIEQGAPADVFASADLVQMTPLQAAGIADPYHIFAHNRLVVVVSSAAPRIRTLADLARPGSKLVLAADTVPAGTYTQQALAKLNTRLGSDFQARVNANVQSQEVNVRQVLAKVVLGEADAGIVYATDAASARGKIRTIPIPAQFNVTAAYPVAVLTHSPVRDRARAFVSFLLGKQGQAILHQEGFLH